uniref:Uncharacterized protein LOC104241643 n=1 Tax=Nicotiana sylvestris TaxID=4096 RepID=A0A1U7XZ22_NICSY
IVVEGITLHQGITKCWIVDVVQRMKPIMQALPSVIIWELWKRRNIYKYGDVVTVNRVLEQYTPKLNYTKVLWELPSQGWIKVNIDGASRGNPGRSSVGFVLRNEEGNVVYACGKEIQEGSNSVAEARAILEALKYCVGNGYVLIELNTDSMMLKNIIGVWKIPWNISEIVEEIKQMMTRCNTTVAHILKEGNSLADYIANYALDHGPLECFGFQDLDSHARRLVNSDKLQCPYIRVKEMLLCLCPIFLVEFQLVVLVLSTHSTGKKPRIGTSIRAGYDSRLSSFSVMDKQLWQATLLKAELVGKNKKVKLNTSLTPSVIQPFSDKEEQQETNFGDTKNFTNTQVYIRYRVEGQISKRNSLKQSLRISPHTGSQANEEQQKNHQILKEDTRPFGKCKQRAGNMYLKEKATVFN